MLRYGLVWALLGLTPVLAAAQALPAYPTRSYPLPTSPVAGEGALGAIYNPASWATLGKGAADFWWNDRSVNNGRLDNWGLAAGRKVGISAYRSDFFLPDGGTGHVTDYQVGVASGKPGTLGGIAYGWSGGDNDLVGRKKYLSFGTILLPSPSLSLGLDWRKALGTSDRDLLGSAAVRALGDKLTVFADYALNHKEVWNEGALQGGIAIRPVHTVQAVFRKREGGEFQISLGLSSPSATVGAASDYLDGDRQRTDYLLRVHPAGSQ